MRSCLALLLAGLGLAACESEGSTLVVDVRTDYVPGIEFFSVEMRGTTPRGAALPTLRTPAVRGDDYLDGIRVAEWDGVKTGSHDVVARLVDASGEAVTQRRVRIAVDGTLTVTIVLARDCRLVTCPSAGAPEATECFGGRCVPPECGGGDSAACNPECMVDGDCPAPVASCAVARCAVGACLAMEEPGSCGGGEYCDPDVGCRAEPPMTDAGAPPEDAGITCDPASCTGGPCRTASCVGGECVAIDRCAEGQLCCDGICFTGSDCAAARPCAGQPAGSVCRPSVGPCDVAEACDGSSDGCPADGFAAAGTDCRSAAGDCDVVEACDGSGAACPSDAVHAADHVCRSAAGPCDVAETCDGARTDCPADSFASLGTPCAAGSSCNGAGACVAGCVEGAACAPSNPCEEGRVTCGGGSPVCVGTGRAGGAGTECRAAAGTCDVAEACTGSSTSCPPNGFVGASTVCRGSAGPCDVPESCSGSDAACPSDAFVAGGSTCRASTGPCDAAETCTGSSAACPSDVLLPPGTICAGADTFCDESGRCCALTCMGATSCGPACGMCGANYECLCACCGGTVGLAC